MEVFVVYVIIIFILLLKVFDKYVFINVWEINKFLVWDIIKDFINVILCYVCLVINWEKNFLV